MNGLDKITARIAAEAQEEIARVQAETREKCRVIGEEYAEKAQEEYWRVIREGAGDAEVQAQHFGAAASLEAKKAVLSMKQDAVAGVLDEAVERICALSGEEYAEFLARLAARAAFTGEEEIILNARDRAAYGRSVVKNANELLRKRRLPMGLSLSGEVGDFRGGLKLRQGDIVVNCTVEMLVSASRDEMVPQIAEILFDE